MTKTTEFNVFPATATDPDRTTVRRPAVIAAVMRSLGAVVLLAGLGGFAPDARAQNTFAFADNARIDDQLTPGWQVGVEVTMRGLPIPEFPPAGNEPIVYTFTPPLPAGLTFDQTSRDITGKVDFDVPGNGGIVYTYSATKGSATAENSLTFRARVRNSRPEVDPGDNQRVLGGTLVRLDGSGSTNGNDGDTGNDGQPEELTYLWTQRTGPTVDLSDATAVNPTFTAPKGNGAEQTLTFGLRVTDEAGNFRANNALTNPLIITVEPQVLFIARFGPTSIPEDVGTVTTTITPDLESGDFIRGTALTINYEVRPRLAGGGTATPGEDYTPLGEASGSLRWVPGAGDARTLEFQIHDDTINEENEAFIVDLTVAEPNLAQLSSALGTQSSASAAKTIIDNDLAFNRTQDNLTFIVGQAVDLALPTARGGETPYRYTLTGENGAGVAGLSLDSATGILSGTLTNELTATVFTYTATDSSENLLAWDPVETGTQTFTITVGAADRPILDRAIDDQVWAVQDRIELILPQIIPATQQGSARYSLSPTLPAGLSFNEATRTISGTITAQLTRTTFTYTARDARGVATDTFDITVGAAVRPTTFVQFDAPTFSGDESAGDVAIEVRLTGEVRNVPLTIPLVVRPGGTATGGEDYTLPDPFEVTFAANAAANTVAEATISLVADDLLEYEERFTLGLDTANLPVGVGPPAIGNLEATFAILDATTGTVGFVSGGTLAAPVPEGGTVDLTVRLDANAGADFTVGLVLADSSAADADDVTLPGPITFPAGTQSGATRTFSVQITDDTLFDGSRTNPTGAETLVLALEIITPPGVRGGNLVLANDAANNYVSEVSLTIEDDDEPGPVTFGEQAIANLEILVDATGYRFELPEAMDGIPNDSAPAYTYTLSGTLPQGLTFDATSSPPVITGTAPAQPAGPTTYSYTATDSATPAGTTAPLTFTLTVKGVVFEVDPAGNGATEDDVLPGKLTAKVDEPATLPLLSPEGAGPFTYSFDPPLPEDLDLDETADPLTITGMPTATVPEREYILTATGANGADTLKFTLEVRPPVDKDAVEETIKSGLAAFGRALGWGDVETVRDRLQRGSMSGGMRVSGLPSGGAETTALSPDSLLTSGANLELGLNATGGSASGIPALNAWVGARRAEIDAEPLSGHKQDGHLNSIRGGVDTRLDNDVLIGTGLGWHDGQLDFSREGGEVTGAMELDLITVNPYVGHSEDGMTVWGTVGAGTGELDYTEDGIGTLSSDVTLISGAAGIEFKRDWNGTELTGRGEGLYSTLDIDAATAGDLEIDDLSADVGGLRAEVEAARPFRHGALMIRPHVNTGLRYDLGDYADDLAYEVGGGLDVASTSFTLSVSGRTQLGSDSFDLSSYALSMAFDRDGDGLGLMLGLDQRVGQATFDPFAATLGTPSASGRELALEAGYGITLGRGVLMPYGEWQVSGSERTASESGLKWTGRDMTFGVRHSYGSGGTLAEERHVLGVTIDIGY